MKTYTEEEIDLLIHCEKRAVTQPKKAMALVTSNLKNEFFAVSTAGNLRFQIFFRLNLFFRENFSIGLVYLPDGGRSVCLFRCNGPHGHTQVFSHHDRFHIHRARPGSPDHGQMGEENVELTTNFTSFASARDFFIQEVRLSDCKDFVVDEIKRE